MVWEMQLKECSDLYCARFSPIAGKVIKMLVVFQLELCLRALHCEEGHKFSVKFNVSIDE